MDFGLLFRKRTATSKQFVQLLLERNNFLQKELPLDILLSYIFSLVISKLLSTPLEISEIVCQALPPSTPRSFFSSVLLPSLIDSRRRGIIVAGLGVDLLSNLCNVIAENLIFDKLSEGKSRYMKKKMSLQNGVIAKVAALIATFPLDLLRTRKVLNEFKVLPDLSNSFSDAVRDSYTVSSIGSGLKPAIAKVAIFVFIKEFFLRQFKVIEKKRDPLDIAPRDTVSKFSKYLMMDYLSGILSEIAIFPLSVIITKLMHSGNNVGMWETIVSTWQKERLKGFFGGLGYHISQSLVIYFSTMLAFLISRTIVSRVKKILREDMDESKDDSREEL